MIISRIPWSACWLNNLFNTKDSAAKKSKVTLTTSGTVEIQRKSDHPLIKHGKPYSTGKGVL